MPEEQIVNDEVVEVKPAQFREEGDEILVNIGVEESEEAPESDPEKDTQKEDTAVAEEKKTETEYEAPKGYEGQDLETVTKRHQDSSSKITELSEKLKNVEAQLGKANLTPQELREQLKAPEVKALLDQEREKLMDMDPDEVSKEELRNQKRLVNELSDEFSNKSHKESIQDIVQSSENKAFKVAQKSELQKKYELSDDEIKNVDGVAENNYLENGKLTPRSYEHAMLSVYGSERMALATKMEAKSEARTEIMTATEKQQAGLDPSAPGTSGTYVNINDLLSDSAKLKEYVDTHSKEEVEKLQAKLKQLM